MTLQVHYDIKIAKFDPNYKPDLTKIRNRLFWDTNINKIDRYLMKIGLVERIFLHGYNFDNADNDFHPICLRNKSRELIKLGFYEKLNL